MVKAAQIKVGLRVRHRLNGLGTVETPVMGNNLVANEGNKYVAIRYDNGVVRFYQYLSFLELVEEQPVPAVVAEAEFTKRKSSDFIDNEFRANQTAWLTEAGAVAGTSKWEPFISTMIRKGLVSQSEAETYRKLDNMLRRWKEAKKYNQAHEVYVLSSQKGYKIGTKEEFEAHVAPMELAANA